MPGNLGSYETMVKLAKFVGGPKRLAVAVAATGFVVPRAAEAGVQYVKRHRADMPSAPQATFFAPGDEVATCREVALTGGVLLPSGTKARVIEQDSDAVVIEVLGRDDNPHVVPASALERDAPTGT